MISRYRRLRGEPCLSKRFHNTLQEDEREERVKEMVEKELESMFNRSIGRGLFTDELAALGETESQQVKPN